MIKTNKNIKWEKNGFIIRLARKEDGETYYEENFCPLDKDIARLTGCKESFTREEVISFFETSLEDENRVFF